MCPREPSSLDYSSLLHVLSLNRWRQYILHEEWKQAELAAGRIAESPEPLWKWLGLVNLAITRLYRGQSQEALSLLDESAQAGAAMRPMSAWSRALAAQVLLEAGHSAEAIERAGLAEREGAGERAEPEAIFLVALAQARLGQGREAEKAVARFERTLGKQWRLGHLTGEVALARGDVEQAVQALARAEAQASEAASDAAIIPLWFSLGSAQFAARDWTEAERCFGLIAESAEERLDWPIPYVRSFYFLGRLAELRDRPRSRERYRRFSTYWGAGDLDSDRLAEARAKSET